jgi:hypothetical protein
MIILDRTNRIYRSVWKIEGRWLIHLLISYDAKRELEHQWWLPYFAAMSVLIISAAVVLCTELL